VIASGSLRRAARGGRRRRYRRTCRSN